MKKSPLVSIVIPCFNSKDILRNCLNSVLATNFSSFEVIVVDDVSTDGSFDILKKEFGNNPKIVLARNIKNLGPSATRNHGIKLSKGKYIAFIETDMEVDPDWLLPMIRVLESDSLIGAVQSKVLDLKRRDRIQAVGVKFNPHTFWVISQGLGAKKDWMPDQIEASIGAVGSIVRKDIIKKVGGFDEKLVHNVDDLDFGWRIWLAGYKILLVPDSITYHWTAKPSQVRTKITPSAQSEFHFHKTPRILLKNYELENVIRYMPWLFFAYTIRVFKNLLAGNLVPFKAFFKATIWNIYTLPNTLYERRRIQKKRKRSDKELFEKLCITGNFLNFYFKSIKVNFMIVDQVFSQNRQKEIFCPVCKQVLINNSSFERKAGNGYLYKICAFCGYASLYPKPTKNTLNNIYQKDDYFSNLSVPISNKLIQFILTRRIFQIPSEWLNKKFKKGVILDVGCGNGEFLLDLKKSGWDVWGNDISRVAVKNVGAIVGEDKVKEGEFTKINFRKKFDVVSFWHVLEHIEDPVTYLNHGFKLLKEKGVIVGECPNFDSLTFKIFSKYYSWIMVPEHIGYFNNESIVRIFKKSGFKKIEVYYPSRSLLNLSFSMDKYLQNKIKALFLRKTIFFFSSPLSILFIILLSFFGRGEVIRFVAKK